MVNHKMWLASKYIWEERTQFTCNWGIYTLHHSRNWVIGILHSTGWSEHININWKAVWHYLIKLSVFIACDWAVNSTSMYRMAVRKKIQIIFRNWTSFINFCDLLMVQVCSVKIRYTHYPWWHNSTDYMKELM